jgi:hypothetical protein
MSRVWRGSLFLFFTLLTASVGFAQTPPEIMKGSRAGSVSAAVEAEQVRFTSRRAVEYMRLHIHDQTGESVYDSGVVRESEIFWAPRDRNGEALKDGLYGWTLTLKEPGQESPRVEHGSLALGRAADKLRTAPAGAGESNESGDAQKRSAAGGNRTGSKVTGSGTVGNIPKWTNTQELGDSVMLELNNRIAIGTSSTALGKLEVFNIDGTGVYGINAGAPGSGVFGISTSTSGSTTGVSGVSYANQGIGVLGSATDPDGTNRGVFGASHSSQGVGVDGLARSTEGDTVGVRGEALSTTGTGVYGIASSTTGVNYGVMGTSESPDGFAGYFVGNVHVDGTLSKGAGSFKIDHPLDPENKYLSHSFVESPDMMNIYNGIVRLDADGSAVVTMPEYFEALNRDFRYQLTCIGGFAPVFVAEKVAGNRFKIAGGRPGMEVSWELTGIRKDAFAEKHRIPVEEMKPAAERGSYLHPEAFDKPNAKRVNLARDHEGTKEQQQARASAATH